MLPQSYATMTAYVDTQTTQAGDSMAKRKSLDDPNDLSFIYDPPLPRIVKSDRVCDERTELEWDNLIRLQEKNLSQDEETLEETKRMREAQRSRAPNERLQHVMRGSTREGRIIPEVMVELIPCYYKDFSPSGAEVKNYVLSNGYVEKVEWYEEPSDPRIGMVQGTVWRKKV